VRDLLLALGKTLADGAAHVRGGDVLVLCGRGGCWGAGGGGSGGTALELLDVLLVRVSGTTRRDTPNTLHKTRNTTLHTPHAICHTPHSTPRSTCHTPFETRRSMRGAALRTLVILPSGPVPLTWARGTPFSSATFLAAGEAKNLGLSPWPEVGGGLAGLVCASPDPYLVSSAGVPREGVVPDLEDDCLGCSLGVSSFFGADSGAAAASEARASAPERSSPSSPMIAMGVPTWMALAPSLIWERQRGYVKSTGSAGVRTRGIGTEVIRRE
jgi:hypothetical protein